MLGNRTGDVESRDRDVGERSREHLLFKRRRKPESRNVEALAERGANVDQPREGVAEGGQEAGAEGVVVLEDAIFPVEILRTGARRSRIIDAVWRGAHERGVVVGEPAEEAVPLAEVVVNAGTPRILRDIVARGPAEVVHAGDRIAGRVGGREEFRDGGRRGVDPIRRNDVAGEGSARESSTGGGNGRKRIVDLDHGAGGVAGLCEIARQLLRGRFGSGERDALHETHQLKVAKEEGLVLAVVGFGNHYRAADGAAELVELERRPGAAAFIGEKIVGVELVIAKELVERKVRIVGPGLGDHVEDAAGGAPILRAEGVGIHLEFLHRVGIGVDDRLILGRRRIRRSIQQKLIGAGPLAVDGDGHGADLVDRQVVDADRLAHARYEHGQRIGISSQQRKPRRPACFRQAHRRWSFRYRATRPAR